MKVAEKVDQKKEVEEVQEQIAVELGEPRVLYTDTDNLVTIKTV